MPIKNRTKISASYKSFIQEIRRLEKFDKLNQINFSKKELTKSQIEILVESIFSTGFRTYENFVREIFLLYCLEKQPSKKPKVKSYLKARDFQHTELLIKSSMPFLDWTSPDAIIERSEVYLENGYPIKLPYTTNLQQLRDYKKIRNHIAHNSMESELHFSKIVKNYFGVVPLIVPSPGKYLMLSSKKNPGKYILLDFFELMKTISIDLT